VFWKEKKLGHGKKHGNNQFILDSICVPLK